MLRGLMRFVAMQASACMFAIAMLALLLGTHYLYPANAPLARYDFLVLAALGVQATLLYFRLETPTEAGVIFIYHVTGTIMEIFKVQAGSWQYPEANMLRVMGVPLFAGFMYASIGSYIFRCWRLFDFRFTNHPPIWTLAVLSVAIYVNFFAHHYTVDIRYVLFAATIALCWRTWVHFRPGQKQRSMPLLAGFLMVAVLIWIAENVGTFSRVWIYPHQAQEWHLVSPEKIGSWFLLMILSYTLVAAIYWRTLTNAPVRDET